MSSLTNVDMKNIPLNDLSRINPSEVEEMTSLFREVFASGNYLKGSHTQKLEQELSNLFSNRPVVAVANGTDALTLAVASLNLEHDEYVGVCPNAGGYGTTAVRRLGLRTVYIDVEPLTGQMDADDLETAITSDRKIRAVIVTHLYGFGGEIDRIADICQKHGIYLIEDCAQSIGARTDTRWLGTFGDLATLSFYPTKNLGAIGDGGAVVCSTSELAQKVSQISQYGWGARYSIERDNSFNSRIDEIQAAILVLRLNKLNEMNSRRREIISRYSSSLNSKRKMVGNNTTRFVGHLAIMISPNRDEDRTILEQLGIGTGIHYPILDSRQKAWYEPNLRQTPNAESFVNQILTIPCFPTMSDDEVNFVCKALASLQ